MDGYLTTREVADRLRVCVPTVLRLVKAGRLPALKYLTKDYRFRAVDVEAFERGVESEATP
jgi:excisionase family DNA binding protein